MKWMPPNRMKFKNKKPCLFGCHLETSAILFCENIRKHPFDAKLTFCDAQINIQHKAP